MRQASSTFQKLELHLLSETWEAAIELDALCGLAWFNLGIEQNRSGKHADAAFSFILCGLVQTWDIEAWVNATLCCLNQQCLFDSFSYH